jgi:hypothetical protein
VCDQLIVVLSVELEAELALSKLMEAFKGEHRAAINRKMKKPLTALAVAGYIYFCSSGVVGRFGPLYDCHNLPYKKALRNHKYILTQTAKLVNAFTRKLLTLYGVE